MLIGITKISKSLVMLNYVIPVTTSNITVKLAPENKLIQVSVSVLKLY